MKIRTRLTIFFTIAGLFLVSCIGAYMNFNVTRVFTQGVYERNSFVVDVVKQHMETANVKSIDDLRAINFNFPRLMSHQINPSDLFWISFYTLDGQLINATNLAKRHPLDISRINLEKRAFSYIYDDVESTPVFPATKHGKVFSLVNSYKIDAGDYSFYTVILFVFTEEAKKIKNILKGLLKALLIVLLCMFVIGFAFVWYTLRPIVTIIEGLHQISKDDLSKRLPVKNPNDEIGELTTSINALFERLERSFNLEKQFVSDISHEFKTPIAVLRLSIENVINNTNLTDEELEGLGGALETLYSMDFLVKKLLYLSRLEQNLCPFNPDNIDPGVVVKKVYDNLALIAESKDLDFKYYIDVNEKQFNGDEELLYLALYNIVENGLKYTDKGSVIIMGTVVDDDLMISVEDTGKGIASDKLNDIFEKFYREDYSRSKQKGYGIGLSIAKRIIDLHGGTIRVESIPGIKTKFEVILPGQE